MMTSVLRKLAVVSGLFLLATVALAESDAPTTAAEVLEKLKSLEGTWTGQAVGEGEAAGEEHSVSHEIRVTGGGSTVMEVMGSGTPAEMINMYHLDGDDLLVTHYCAGGNQPRMKLDRELLAQGMIHFAFDGGTNLDSANDFYIRSGTVLKLDPGHFEARWTSWHRGEEAGAMIFKLNRQE